MFIMKVFWYMKKDKCTEDYKRIFKDEGIKKVIPYRSPKDGNVFKLERVNPDHVGIIWGKPKRKPSSFIKFAKVYFAIFPITFGLAVSSWLDFYTHHVFNILGSIGFYTLFLSFLVATLYYLPIVLSIRKRVGVSC